ncbi:MAG: hypothetical protein IKF56_05205 [Eggerthellaceae bacterium]|nr:hypothetical protein [Eggerthellaceae bacterium]
MKNIAKLVAIAALSAVLAIGIAGCGSSQSSASAGSSSASESASAQSAASSAASSLGETASSASSASESEDWGRGDAEPVDLADSQRFGRASTGYVSVPSDWKDFTDKLDPRMVDSTDATYIVDPTTEFTSAVESHFAYSSSITLEVFPCKYTDKADELLYKYRGETDNYMTPSIEKITFNGKDASILGVTSADNVDITNIVIERDANTCILITAWGTRSTDEAVLGYVSTWSMDK